MFSWKKGVYMIFNITGSEIGSKPTQEVYNKADTP